MKKLNIEVLFENMKNRAESDIKRYEIMDKISIAVKPAYNQETIMLMAKSDNCKSAVFRRPISKT